MIYVLLIAAIVSLIVLYKFLPTRKIFLVICALLIVVFGASAFIHARQAQREQITRAQLEELQARQKIFGEWYADYQKDMDAQNFNAEAFYQRLKQLEQESIEEQIKIHTLHAPPELDRENRKLVEEIIRKTRRYVEAQTQAISLSATAANPPVEPEILRARLHDIMIRESPEGLFIAQEISAIRSALRD